jgi:hypothetical protein
MSRCSRRVWVESRISPYDRKAERESGSGRYRTGRLHLERCDITSQSIACVGIHGGADPRLLRNPHPRWKDAGVYVDDERPEGPGRTTTFSATLFRPWKSRRSEERRGDQNGRSADSSPRRWSISDVDHRLALWKDPCWPSDRRAVGPTPEGRTRPSEAVADRATAGTASGQSNPLPRENSVGGFKGIVEKEGALLLSLAPRGPPFKPKGKPS